MAINLSSLHRGKRARPPKVVIYGGAKLGKTTFAASAPNAVGILTEEGADAIDCTTFPVAHTLTAVYDAIGALYSDPHDFQTVFLDSLDWCEPLIHTETCRQLGVKHIEEPGYGKGYVAAADEWRKLLSGFDALRDERGMTVILIAHDKITKYESPTSESYDRFTMKLHQKAVGILEEWADVIGFCQLHTLTKVSKTDFGQKEVKAKTTGEHLLYLRPDPAYVAGNRYSLPASIPMPAPQNGNPYGPFLEAIAASTVPAEKAA